ncbi:MAG TPA: CBS domain-containing protein [Mycobacteriales bacterium]|nr:CBS domain-containing protein [Mycobacteriales bacterium]
MTPPEVSSRVVTAADVMSSPVITVPATGTIWDAWSVLVSCGVRHAVVVSGARCVGVVDDRLLVQAWQQGPSALRTRAIKGLLAERTSCVLPETEIGEVAALMNLERLDAVPVVDGTGRLIGLLTAGDIVHAVARYGLHDELHLVSLGSSDDDEQH